MNAVPKLILLVVLASLVSPSMLGAYTGPGAGLSAIGAAIALIASILLGIFGFVWYPLKRILGARRARSKGPSDDTPE